MVAAMPLAVAVPSVDAEQDQHVILHDMAWQDFEAMLALRGDRAGVRMYYLDGAIEFMSPAKTHEGRKTTLARLLEYWALETGVSLAGYGSWTLKKEIREAGGEPDECYILGRDKDVPDLVIEVEWSRALGLAKQEIHRRLGVRELWTLKAGGRLVVRVLQKGEWALRSKSKLLPKLDMATLAAFVSIEPQADAVRKFRDHLRASTTTPKAPRVRPRRR
jgi:Uma2 family endonuclease